MVVVMEPTIETITHSVYISKDAGRQLNDDKMRAQVDQIIAGANTTTRLQKGWRTELRPQGLNRGWYNQNFHGSGYVYSVMLNVTLEKSRRDPSVLKTEFDNIVESLRRVGKSLPGNPWVVAEVDGEEWKSLSERTEEEKEAFNNTDIGYAPIRIPENWDAFFEGLYGLDYQIARARWALENAIDSGFESRIHTLFVGPPGCGKSHICQMIKAALGEEAVIEFDATSTTMVGLQKELAEREELPRVILIEEIEKAPEGSMQSLLSILDIRAEIRRITARGNIERDTKLIAVATCNDYALLKSKGAGALASRFGRPVYFRRPSRALLGRILQREVDKFGGNPAWIQPTLDFCETLDTSDPREVIGHMMVGRYHLLDGSYQEAVLATAEPDEEWNGEEDFAPLPTSR